MFAARRVKRNEADLRLAQCYAAPPLAAITVAALGNHPSGRPSVSVFQMITLAIFLAFVLWASRRLLLRRADLFHVLRDRVRGDLAGCESDSRPCWMFGLAATPVFLTRLACVVCLGCGISLLVISMRMFRREGQRRRHGARRVRGRSAVLADCVADLPSAAAHRRQLLIGGRRVVEQQPRHRDELVAAWRGGP